MAPSATIGPIRLAVPFCQAGLEGYSDRAMRVVARRRGCPFAVTEAMLDTLLVGGGEHLRRAMDVADEDHPVAGQIIGAEPATMARAARLVHDAGYDVIDLNFACPVKKATQARGGHMLSDVARGVSILRAVREALPPEAITTVSLRRAFDDTSLSADRFDEIVAAAWSHGYSAIRVHGRTVEQKYAGRSRWEFLRALKARWPSQTIVGSGDVFTAEDAVRLLRDTGVDIVWIARGAIGNPWIFRDAAKLLRGEAITPPTVHDQRQALLEHLEISRQIHADATVARRMRKFGIKYSRFHPEAAAVMKAFVGVRSLEEWSAVLKRHYAEDAAGCWPSPNGVADAPA